MSTDATPSTDSSTPANVVAALARVMAEIGGIDKLTATERARRGLGGGDQGIAYAYRGIDQIAQRAQPLLGRYGVVILPTIVESHLEQFTINNRPWVDHFITVRWDIYGPGGLDDHLTSTTMGIGRDNSDKSANKAMTGAFKNLLLRLLCIGDPADDTDGHTVERDAPPPAAPPPPRQVRSVSEQRIRAMLDAADPELRRRVQSAFKEQFGSTLTELSTDEHDAALNFVINRLDPDHPDNVDAAARAAADAAHAAAEAGQENPDA